MGSHAELLQGRGIYWQLVCRQQYGLDPSTQLGSETGSGSDGDGNASDGSAGPPPEGAPGGLLQGPAPGFGSSAVMAMATSVLPTQPSTSSEVDGNGATSSSSSNRNGNGAGASSTSGSSTASSSGTGTGEVAAGPHHKRLPHKQPYRSSSSTPSGSRGSLSSMDVVDDEEGGAADEAGRPANSGVMLTGPQVSQAAQGRGRRAV